MSLRTHGVAIWRLMLSVTAATVMTNGAMGPTSTGTAFVMLPELLVTDTPPPKNQGQLPSCPGSTRTAAWTNCVGEEMIADGGRYVGAFRDGKFHGQGTLETSDGKKYVGEFWRGDPHGHGRIHFPDGTEYVGGFWIGKYSKGTLTFPDGAKFVGEFWDNKYSRGTYTFPDGSKYAGDFRNGKRYGQGVEYSADGAVVRSGFWENDVHVGGP